MKKILGFVEGFSGSNVVGWAIDPDQAGNCFIELVNGDGERIGSGRAARQRDDLVTLGLGRTNFGFCIPVKKLSGFDALRVLIDGYELPGSPLKVGPGIFDGRFRISGGVAVGSVTERCSKLTPAPLITIVSQDGEVVGQANADVEPQALDAICAARSFEIPLNSSCYGQSELVLTAFADRCRFYQIESALRLSGNIDIITPDAVHGWLLCPDAPRKKFIVTLWADGQLAGRSVCNLRRDDLRGLYPECLDAGFHLKRTDLCVPRNGLSELSIRLEGSYVDLFGGPFIVGGRVSHIDAAKNLAKMVHRLGPELDVGERSLMQDILRDFLRNRRLKDDYTTIKRVLSVTTPNSFRRINILIPIYKGVEITRDCIDSVLADRSGADIIVLVADCPPEPEMMPMLAQYRGIEGVFLLENKTNLGFVGAVNRGLNFCRSGDVLLLNSDTRLFRGALDELWASLHSSDDIATATALSNNATIFSYPHPQLVTKSLDDVSWAELADIAMRSNKGSAIEVPTGHGFCLLVRREVLDRLGSLSTEFGRGYGEENEFCARASDLGYRHVAASAVFVEHVEAVSFGPDKAKLVEANLMKLGSMFPEYTATIMAYEGRDDLRSSRWALDEYRLGRARKDGARYVLVVENWQDGGAAKAVSDIEKQVGYDGRGKLRLACTAGGLIELESDALRLRGVFSRGDYASLFGLLSSAGIDLVVVHQLLGYDEQFISLLGDWARKRTAVYFAHDFYSACPRVNLIDAVDTYCGAANEDVCARCVKFGGSHSASRLQSISPKDHRDLFSRFFDCMTSIVAPSNDTKRHLKKIFTSSNYLVVPHPELPATRAAVTRSRKPEAIALLGAIGPHKGSKKLLEIASQAVLSHPTLTFHVIGYTDIDEQLSQLPNIIITGRYVKADLARHVELSQATVALFLHVWPETFSYTFSESLEHGLIPIVPNIGAPADRARESGIGIVYPFPIVASEVLTAIDSCLRNPQTHTKQNGKTVAESARSVASLRRLFTPVSDRETQDCGDSLEAREKPVKRRRAPKRSLPATVAS